MIQAVYAGDAVVCTTEYRKGFSTAGECDRMVVKEVIKL